MMNSKLLIALSFVLACNNSKAGNFDNSKSADFGSSKSAGAASQAALQDGNAEPSPLALQIYARQLSGTIAGRPLKKDERTKLAAEGDAALPALLKGWMEEDFFARSFRSRVETMLGTSGKRDDVDFNLPGNLAAYVVKEKMPVANLLTADFCVDAEMKKIDCDTGAPYNAGVITTRGYMVAHNGRFNLGRAISMMNVFACAHYPMSSALQPYAAVDGLIENFRIQSEEEAKAKGTTGFGNGSACYSCHGQFAQHTQLFVKFDDKGKFLADATGAQDANLEFGRGENGTYASHFEDKSEAASEFGDVFGARVDDLAAAGKVLTEHPAFVKCMAKNAITHALSLDSEAGKNIDLKLLDKVSESISQDQPKVADIYLGALSHPLVIQAFSRGVAGE